MAGAESAPALGPILIACGIGELTTWRRAMPRTTR